MLLSDQDASPGTCGGDESELGTGLSLNNAMH